MFANFDEEKIESLENLATVIKFYRQDDLWKSLPETSANEEIFNALIHRLAERDQEVETSFNDREWNMLLHVAGGVFGKDRFADMAVEPREMRALKINQYFELACCNVAVDEYLNDKRIDDPNLLANAVAANLGMIVGVQSERLKPQDPGSQRMKKMER